MVASLVALPRVTLPVTLATPTTVKLSATSTVPPVESSIRLPVLVSRVLLVVFAI